MLTVPANIIAAQNAGQDLGNVNLMASIIKEHLTNGIAAQKAPNGQMSVSVSVEDYRAALGPETCTKLQAMLDALE